jgi:hypothetical protein
MAVNSGDSYGQACRLLEESDSILQPIRASAETYKRFLPQTAITAINQLLDRTLLLVSRSTATGATRKDAAAAAVLQL